VHARGQQDKNGNLEDNPARDIDIQDIQRKQLHVILSRQELERIYNDYGNTQPPPSGGPTRNWEQASALATKRNKVILGLVVFQGLNSHELQALTLKSLELRAGKVHVEGGRRHNGRSFTLEAAQVLDLMEYLPDRQAGTLGVRGDLLKLRESKSRPEAGSTGMSSRALFVSVGSGSALNNTLNKLLQQITKLEPKVKTLQQLRASVITAWLKTHNLREAQHKAGHRYVSSTEAYFINDLEGLAEDVARFHPIG